MRISRDAGTVDQHRLARHGDDRRAAHGRAVRLHRRKLSVLLRESACSSCCSRIRFSAFIVSGIGFMTFFWTQLLMNVVFTMYSGAGPAALAEMFPTRVRSTGVAFGGALATILGGFSPFLTTWTIASTGGARTRVGCSRAARCLTLPALVVMKDRAREQSI